MLTTKTVQRVKSLSKFGLKLGLTTAALYLVFTKINQELLLQQFRDMHWGYIFLAFLAMVGSKLISAVRLLHFIHAVPLQIEPLFNLKLYWLGMFYNLFLPGGIGGDGYKAYILNKHSTVSLRSIVWALLLDRVSGLLALTALGLVMMAFFDIPALWKGLALLAPLLMYVSHALFIWWLHSRHKAHLWSTHVLSLGVQLGQLLSAFLVLMAIGQHEHVFAYLELFLLSSVVSVLPISIGGVGAREMTFMYGANYLGVPAEPAVALSLMFFMLLALNSLIGSYFEWHFPELQDWKQQELSV